MAEDKKVSVKKLNAVTSMSFTAGVGTGLILGGLSPKFTGINKADEKPIMWGVVVAGILGIALALAFYKINTSEPKVVTEDKK